MESYNKKFTKKILLIGSRSGNLNSFKNQLSEVAAEIYTADSMKDLMNKIENTIYDLILIETEISNRYYKEAVILISKTENKFAHLIFRVSSFKDIKAIANEINIANIDFIIKSYPKKILIDKINILLDIQLNGNKTSSPVNFLENGESNLVELLYSITDHMSLLDKDLNIVWANETAKNLFGDNIIGKKCYKVYHNNQKPCEPYPCITLKAFRDGQIHEHQTTVIDSKGRQHVFHCTANCAFRDKNDFPMYVLEVSRDITEQKNTENKLRKNEKLYKNIIRTSMDGCWMHDIAGNIIDVNDAYCKMSGYTKEELIGSQISLVEPEYQINKTTRQIDKTLEVGGNIFESKHRRKDGTFFDIEISSTYQETNGKRIVSFIRDITGRKEEEEAMKRLNEKLKTVAFSDSLTGALNRKPFTKVLSSSVKSAKRKKQKLAVLFLDLEKFKEINDIYGHTKGDKALTEAVKKFEKNIRSNDVVGRIGGDEFVICLKDVKSIDNAVNIAKKINKSFERKIYLDDIPVDLTVSIGISIYPEDGSTALDLLKFSDIAMYKAKNRTRNSFQVYNKEYINELEMEQELLKALESKELSVFYQPIIDKNGTCKYMEALLRWNNSIFGNVPPSVFVPILEKNKAINTVGNWMFEEACKQIRNINSIKDFEDIAVSVNLSGVQIEEEDFLELFYDILNKTEVNSENILFEVTEEKKMEDIENVINVLSKLRSKSRGLVALDDYGSGYSSFSNLIRFPIDIVKLDKFLVDNITCEKTRKATLGIISLIKQLNYKIIAEGIELIEQFNILREAGCDYFQGYLFSKPIPNIQEVLKENKGNFLNNIQ